MVHEARYLSVGWQRGIKVNSTLLDPKRVSICFQRSCIKRLKIESRDSVVELRLFRFVRPPGLEPGTKRL